MTLISQSFQRLIFFRLNVLGEIRSYLNNKVLARVPSGLIGWTMVAVNVTMMHSKIANKL